MQNRKIKILIVEDEVVVAKDLHNVIIERGYECCGIAKNFEDALHYLSAKSPDFVLLDITLPGKYSGIDIGRHLIEKDTIPFVYLTSHSDYATLNEAKATRPSGYLVKPFKEEDIFTSIELAMFNFAHRNIDHNRTEENIVKDDIPYKIRKVINYILTHQEARPNLAEMANIAEMSIYHFARSFKNCMDVSPYQYVINRKIKYAKGQLIATNRNIISISMDVGYDNHSHFSQVFKKAVGFTPDGYRKTYARL